MYSLAGKIGGRHRNLQQQATSCIFALTLRLTRNEAIIGKKSRFILEFIVMTYFLLAIRRKHDKRELM